MHKQAGALLLEYMVVLALLTWSGVWAVDFMQRQLREQQLKSTVNWGLQVREAIQDYLVQLDQARGQSSDWVITWPYANWREPTLQELQLTGLLSAHFPTASSLGQAQVYVIGQSPCEAEACRLDGLISLSLSSRSQWLKQAHYQTFWKLHSQGYGLQASGPVLQGPGGVWPNPPLAGKEILNEGTVGLSVFKQNRRTERFLTVGDLRDPDFGGGLSVKGTMTARDDMNIEGVLFLHRLAQPFSVCDQEQAIAREASAPGFLLCSEGRWRTMGRAGGGAYSKHADHECGPANARYGQPNPVTGYCSCPSGYTALLMAEFAVDFGPLRSYVCVA